MVHYLKKISQYLKVFLSLPVLGPLMNLNYWGEHFKRARVIFTGTVHVRYEIIYMRNGQNKWWIIYVIPLDNDVFDILVKMHPVLSKSGFDEEVIKVTNCMPRKLMYLVGHVRGLDKDTNINNFKEVLKTFE